MIAWLYAGVLLFLAWISYFCTRNIYNPGTLFCGFWSLLLCFSALRLYGIESNSDAILNTVLLGNICFFIGAIRKTPKLVMGRSFKPSQVGKTIAVNHTLFIVLLAFCVVALLYRFSFQIPYLIAGSSISDIRYQSQVKYSQLSLILFNFFALPFLDASITVLISSNVLNNKPLKSYLMPVLLLVMSMISNGARLAIYQICIIFLFALLINHRISINAKALRKYMPVFVVFVGLALFVNNDRSSDNGLLKGIYTYFCGSFVFGDYVLTKTSFLNEFLYGVNSFGGIVRTLFAFLGILGIRSPESLTQAGIFMSQNMQNTIIVINDSGELYNYFCTCFLYFYKDGGYVAVAVIAYIYGMICRYSFDRFTENNNICTLSMYLYIVSGITISMMHFCFASFIYVMALVYIWMLTTMSKTKLIFKINK